MRNKLTFGEKLEQKMYCFGGGGGGGGGGSKSPDPTRQAGQNTRVDSRGNTVNFNTGPTKSFDPAPNFTKTLPNGVEVVDFSTPFGGQVNLSNQAAPSGAFGDLGRGVAEQGLNNPEVFSPVTGTTSINPSNFTNMPTLGAQTNFGSFGSQINDLQQSVTPTSPTQALQQALDTGRVQLGGGFYAGKTPMGGFGLGVERTFAKGGVVENQGIASLMRKK